MKSRVLYSRKSKWSALLGFDCSRLTARRRDTEEHHKQLRAIEPDLQARLVQLWRESAQKQMDWVDKMVIKHE